MTGQRSRDPNAPKNAVTAVQFFAKANREELKASKPDLSSADLQSAIADAWRDLPPKDRAPYVKSALKDKQRYQSEAKGYIPPVEHLKATKGGNRLQKDPLRPKAPRSAYIFYGDFKRAQLAKEQPGTMVRDQAKVIGNEWGALTESGRAPYVKQAEADKARYMKAMESYEPSEAYLAAREKFKKDRKGGPSDGSGETVRALEEENKGLKRKLEQAESLIAKQSKKIDGLKEKAAGKEAKVAAKEAKAAAKEAGREAKQSGKAVASDDAKYLKWTESVLGKNGEKADDEMTEILSSQGPAGLAKFLAKKYKAEQAE